MSVFNSLGSNYSAGLAFKSIITFGSRKRAQWLLANLAKYFGVEPENLALLYKGRQALELALKQTNLPAGSKVGINGFTCYVVYQAVEKAGYQPVFIDIEPGKMDFGAKELESSIGQHELKALVVQNTLGLPQDIAPIERICKKNGIVIVEDLAHSLGASYGDGRKVGTVGDFVMLSFSQDKPLDVVAGGALLSRKNILHLQALPMVSITQRLINRFYPLFTLTIRTTYSWGAGRYIHFVLKKLHLLATPMSDNITQPYKITSSATGLLSLRWDGFKAELNHRRDIAGIYAKELPRELQILATQNSSPSYLRFPIRIDKRDELVSYLKNKNIYIGDTWYDAPIGPARYLKETNYKAGLCPESERLTKTMVNLPTHLNVSPQNAVYICATIKQWLASQ